MPTVDDFAIFLITQLQISNYLLRTLLLELGSMFSLTVSDNYSLSVCFVEME